MPKRTNLKSQYSQNFLKYTFTELVVFNKISSDKLK